MPLLLKVYATMLLSAEHRDLRRQTVKLGKVIVHRQAKHLAVLVTAIL